MTTSAPKAYISHSGPWIVEDDRQRVDQVLCSGGVARGSEVARLEADIAARIGATGSVATASGTAALVLALRALEIGPGCEVVIPDYVCVAVRDAVLGVGAEPVLCDVGDEWRMTVESVESRVTRRTRAIVLVHLFGIAVDPSPFLAFGVPIIEDCCQAMGAPAPWSSTPVVGNSGLISVFSFHATKCLTAGEGGIAVTSDPMMLKRMRALLFSNVVPAPLSDLQAALARSQLARYDQFLAERRRLAAMYFDRLPSRATEALLRVSSASMFFRFPLRLEPQSSSFEDARSFFHAAGIAVRRGVDALLHRDTSRQDEDFPGAVRCFRETLSIPLRPGLSDDDYSRVVERVQQFVSIYNGPNNVVV